MDDTLPVPIDPPKLERVRAAIVSAGDVAVRGYSEDEYWDYQAFTGCLWKLIWNAVERACQRHYDIPSWWDDGALRFQLDGYRCAVYSLGCKGSRDPWDYDFGRTNKRREAADQNQLRLFALGDVEHDVLPDDAICSLMDLHVVYCPSVRTGVEAIYVGAPLLDRSSPTWAWVRTIHDDGQETVGAPLFPVLPRGPYPSYGDRHVDGDHGLRLRTKVRESGSDQAQA